MFMGIILVLAIGASASGTARRMTGLVTAVTDTSLRMTTDGKQFTTVGVDDRTSYMKWITHQPWQQDTRLNSRSVAVGSCVQVDLRAGDSRIAKIVWINVDGASTAYDPCKRIREDKR
jgi:hypothetical protein